MKLKLPQITNELIYNVATVAVICGLSIYTTMHTARMLATYSEWSVVGWVAATSIEIGIILLSIMLHDSWKQDPWGGNPLFHAALLFMLMLVSALANIASGFEIKFGQELVNFTDLQARGGFQIAVSLVATMLMPILVFALSEQLGKRANAGTGETESVWVDEVKTWVDGVLSEVRQELADMLTTSLATVSSQLSEVKTEADTQRLTDMQKLQALITSLTTQLSDVSNTHAKQVNQLSAQLSELTTQLNTSLESINEVKSELSKVKATKPALMVQLPTTHHTSNQLPMGDGRMCKEDFMQQYIMGKFDGKTQTQIASETGIALSTLQRYITEIKSSLKPTRNGTNGHNGVH